MATTESTSNGLADQTQIYLTKAEPPWVAQLLKARKERDRTVFLLHFNIRDFVFDPEHPPIDPDHLLTTTEYLVQMFGVNRHVVLDYSLHSGLQARAGIPLGKTNGGGVAADISSSRSFRHKEYKSLWKDIAKEASRDPFSLIPDRGQPADEPGEADNWVQPRNVMPLLRRVFTQGYTIGRQRPEVEDAPDTNAKPEILSVALIIDYLHHLAPAPGGINVRHDVPQVVETLQSWSTNPDMQRGRHVVIALTPEIAAVDPELTRSDSYVERIRLERPDRDQRSDFLRWLSQFDKYVALQLDGMVDELANRASGMNYRDLGEFAVGLAADDEERWKLDLARRRAEIIRRESGGLLEPKESKYGLEHVAGYKYVTKEINRRLDRIRAGKADIAGILFNGPPGTGKSFYAGALARSGGVNMVVIRNLRGMYVGQSERNLEQIFEVARTLAPVMIFVDEIDQVFANRERSMDTSGGVEQRLLGRLLEFMDDKQNLGKVIWIAASNRPDLIDQALLSRFKLRLPFLLPDRDACIELLRDQLPDQAEFRWQLDTWEEGVVEEVVGKYSGREIDTIVRQALWKAKDDAELISGEAKDVASRLQARRKQLHERSMTLPNLPVISTGEAIEVHGQYLREALYDAEVGHDEEEYLAQSLRALNSAPFTSPELIESVKTALRPEIVYEIVDNGRLDKKAIRRLIEGPNSHRSGRDYR